MLTTVADLRTVNFGPPIPGRAAGRLPGAGADEAAAWCWFAAGDNYTLVAGTATQVTPALCTTSGTKPDGIAICS